MNNFILSGIIFSILPFFELRAGLPLLYAGGLPLWAAAVVSAGISLLAFPLVYFFFNYLHGHFIKFRHYELWFRRLEERYKRKAEKKLGGAGWEYWLFFIFVILPFPGTGAYSGAFLSWLFNMDKRKSFLAVALGVVVEMVIVGLITLGVITVF